MDGHKAWIKKGFDDGVFMLVGSLQPNRGGGIIAGNCSADDLQERVNNDPFVMEDVVKAEIIELTASMANEQLEFLIE